jgi:ATP-binding cassette subfamily B protein
MAEHQSKDDIEASATAKTHQNHNDEATTNSEGSKKEAELQSSKPSFGKLFLLAKPEIPMLIFSGILMVGSEAVNLITPLIVADAYDTLVDPNVLSDDARMSEINRIMIIAIIVTIAGILGGFIRATIQGVIGERVVARLRCQLYAHILRQEIAFFDEHKSGELVSRLGSDTTLLQMVISQSLPECLVQFIKAVASMGLMFFLSAKLAGVALAGVLVIFLLSAPMGKLMARLSKEYQDVLGQAQTHSTEAIGSMRTVQGFAAEEKESKRYNEKIGNPDDIALWWPPKEPQTTYRVGFFKSITQSAFFTFVFGAGFGYLNVTLWYGFYLVIQGELTLGELTAFNSFIITIGFAMGQFAAAVAKVFEGMGASGRVFYLLDRVPLIPKPQEEPNVKKPDPVKPESMEGNVELQNVIFHYPSRPEQVVLNDVSLKIPANSTTALVGSSGAGKSTIVSLLQRFYDVDQGRITVDGNTLEDLDLQWLRSHIGYVQQEPQLFGLTVKENMLYGVHREVTMEEIEQAAKDAHAHEFIKDWPEGYDTLVGERGVKLSGGQKQRVAIARALLTNCRILLLDEATSALDAESEHLVQQAIDKAVVGRTVIVVAHRLSTIRQADQIVVMHDHKIVDVGKHDELLSRCTKYQDLIKRQSTMIRDVSMNALSSMLPDMPDEDDDVSEGQFVEA